MEVRLSNQLPVYPSFVPGIRRAPDRGYSLTPAQTETALKNALRYIPEELHEVLAPEFMEELMTRGRIYGYRYRPEGDLKAKPVDQYKGQCLEGKAFQVMIDNNLSFDIALYPYELVTYGETGQVCQNWMQYRLIKQYLEILTSEQTLVIESGHPLGLFRSKPDAPRVIITNSMMVGLFDNQKDWHIAAQMGVANYGQMTAGGWMYIGPQGDRARDVQYLIECRAEEIRHSAGSGFAWASLCLLRSRRNEWGTTESGRYSRCCQYHCRSGQFPHPDPPFARLGSACD